MRTFPLPAYFGAYGTTLSTILGLALMVRLDPGAPGRWNHTSAAWLLLDVVALPVAMVLTVREANRRKRAGADQAGYRTAVETGQPIGAVSRWTEWIWRDRNECYALAIVSVLGVGWWMVEAFDYGPWWTGGIMMSLSATTVWLSWRTLRDLRVLSQSLGAPRD